jgi:hypothetical protein
MMQLAFRRRMSGKIWIFLWLVPLFCVDAAAQSVDYARQVQPILHRRCAQVMEKKLRKGV